MLAQVKDPIKQIIERRESLSKSEGRIADYILNHRTEVASLNANEIAEESHTSASTMSRFVRSLGFESFTQLRLALAQQQRAVEGVDASISGPSAISRHEFRSSLNFILRYKIEELTDTTTQIKEAAVNRIVDAIKAASLVMVAGVGNTASVAANFSYKLCQLGIRCVSPASSDNATLLAMQLGARDCLIVLSSSGSSRRLRAIMNNARDGGATVALITSTKGARLARYADTVITTVSKDEVLSGSQRFSQSSLVYVSEVIYLFLRHELEFVDENDVMFWKSGSFDRETECEDERAQEAG